MIWFTWRQFRAQSWITIGALAAIGALLVITAFGIADAYDTAGIATCQDDCATAIDNFLREVQSGLGGTVYDLADAAMYLIPAVIGLFWGAPLLARELETGTHRVAWNQSVTRTRWLATKLAVVGGAAVATVGLLSWAITVWSHRIDEAIGERISPGIFAARGIVPIGYAIFAFVLGVTLGMLIRRTVPAMAATLAVYGVVFVSMEIWIRENLVSASQLIRPLDMSSLETLLIDDSNNEMTVIGSDRLSDAWVLSNQSIAANGEVFTGPSDPRYCGIDATPQACEEWVGGLGLRQELTYHPASNFWPLQWVETGILVVAAVLLAGFCFWWTRRRLT